MRSFLRFAIIMIVSAFAGIAFPLTGRAATEPYVNFLKGSIKKNDTVVVKDEKFRNTSVNWNDISNISVKNDITLTLIDETPISQSFSCDVDLKIQYFSSPDQTDTTVINNVRLHINYDNTPGATYKITDTYSFSGAYWVKVTATRVYSPQFGTDVPPNLQLNNNITINRQYKFTQDQKLGLQRSLDTVKNRAGNTGNGKVNLSWTPTGADEYDLEWTTVDKGSANSDIINQMGLGTVNDTTLNKLFRNNATRVTTSGNEYAVSLVFDNDYLAFRIRQVQYDTSGIRKEGNWDYTFGGGSYAYIPLSDTVDRWHEPDLNWQYSSAYAEEGKKKEVISYFDGTLRNRQTVTINNSDNIPVAQENIYDEFGRAALSMLPAPYKDTSALAYRRIHSGNDTISFTRLHFNRNFNLNAANKAYNFANIHDNSCVATADRVNNSSGAGKYYSDQSDFLTNNQFIPQSEGYPYSATQYSADNTGRITVQGGVGYHLQPNISDGMSDHVTRYYYGKPEQWELDQIFGNDAGYAEHYQKNMVIDPNGQISVSYVNASGKTVATALTGSKPSYLNALPSLTAPVRKTINLLKPDQFVFDNTALQMSATTTYLASVIDTATFNYNIEQLVYKHPGAFNICGHCYYNLSVKVIDDCNNEIYTDTKPVGTLNDISASQPDNFSKSFALYLPQIGEYHISLQLALSKTAIEDYVTSFVSQGQQLGALKTEQNYLFKYLDGMDYTGCLSDCRTSLQTLGDSISFRDMLINKIIHAGVDTANIPGLKSYAGNKWHALHEMCVAAFNSCNLAPCNDVEAIMEQDVSPGGQYALFDANDNPLETEINVLNDANLRAAFPPATPHTDPAYQQELITTEKGAIINPYDASFTVKDLVKYWKPEWAQRFLSYHPEYCKLLFCYNMSKYKDWDARINLFDSITDLEAVGSLHITYDHDSFTWLLNNDPFFTDTVGHNYYNAALHDLQNYSSSVSGNYNASTKNITELVDYMLYYAGHTTSDGTAWGGYDPIAEGCRVKDREWQQYRSFYLEMKDKYYQKLQDSTTCKGKCSTIGQTVSLQLPGACPTPIDFFIQQISSHGDSSVLAVSYVNGKVSSGLTVSLYYPSGINTTNLPDTLHFKTGDSYRTITVSNAIPETSVHVSHVVCDIDRPGDGNSNSVLAGLWCYQSKTVETLNIDGSVSQSNVDHPGGGLGINSDNSYAFFNSENNSGLWNVDPVTNELIFNGTSGSQTRYTVSTSVDKRPVKPGKATIIYANQEYAGLEFSDAQATITLHNPERDTVYQSWYKLDTLYIDAGRPITFHGYGLVRNVGHNSHVRAILYKNGKLLIDTLMQTTTSEHDIYDNEGHFLYGIGGNVDYGNANTVAAEGDVYTFDVVGVSDESPVEHRLPVVSPPDRYLTLTNTSGNIKTTMQFRMCSEMLPPNLAGNWCYQLKRVNTLNSADSVIATTQTVPSGGISLDSSNVFAFFGSESESGSWQMDQHARQLVLNGTGGQKRYTVTSGYGPKLRRPGKAAIIYAVQEYGGGVPNEYSDANAAIRLRVNGSEIPLVDTVHYWLDTMYVDAGQQIVFDGYNLKQFQNKTNPEVRTIIYKNSYLLADTVQKDTTRDNHFIYVGQNTIAAEGDVFTFNVIGSSQWSPPEHREPVIAQYLTLTNRSGSTENILQFKLCGSGTTPPPPPPNECSSWTEVRGATQAGADNIYQTVGSNGGSYYTVYQIKPTAPYDCPGSHNIVSTQLLSTNPQCLYVYDANGNQIGYHKDVYVVECDYTNSSGGGSGGSGGGEQQQMRMMRALVVPADCPEALKYKTPRFGYNIDKENNYQGVDTVKLKNDALAQIDSLVRSSCEGNADYWMQALAKGLSTASDAQKVQLRAALINVCASGGDSSHVSGASSIAPGATNIDADFGAAIKRIFGGFTADLNPWLIESPPPYGPRQQAALRVISVTDPSICGKLTALESQYTTDAALASYLNISTGDLAVLKKSCTNCRNILDRDIQLPVQLDEGTGCVNRNEFMTAVTDFNNAFNTTPDSTGDNYANYKLIYTNFLNQRWGFTLSYQKLKDFENSTEGQLCNIPVYATLPADQWDCIEGQIAVAVSNAERQYSVYIDSTRKDFRTRYTNFCAGAKTLADLEVKQQIYHYTLYYYDQADNLVRTVPPEGVELLTDDDLRWVDQVRDHDSVQCNEYKGPCVNSNKSQAFTKLKDILNNNGPTSIEMWLYNLNYKGLNHLVEVDSLRNYLFQATIADSTLAFDVFPLTGAAAGTITFSPTSGHYRATIPRSMLPLVPWTHLVMQGSALGSGANLPQLYLNGTQLTVTNAATAMPGGWTVTATPTKVIYPDSMQTLKHLRLYTRLMTGSEILANATNDCLMPSDTNQMDWYRFNVPDPGTITTVADTSRREKRYTPIFPLHRMTTTYAYNATNQVIKQNTPDGGTTSYWYDLTSRLVASQNDKQKAASLTTYSYTRYDNLGRIIEVGQKAALSQDSLRHDNSYLNIDSASHLLASGTNTQITRTYYDNITGYKAGSMLTTLSQNNLRKRVAASAYFDDENTFGSGMYYDYDLDGNVKTLYRQIPGLGTKQVNYQYDLISGKVNFVAYQHGQPDQFSYAYKYDADNRLTEAWSSPKDTLVKFGWGSMLDETRKRMDAAYYYYPHGPLKRVEYGDVNGKIQGMDYAYTLQGWLKGVNSNAADLHNDMGQDSATVAKDAYGYSLHYFDQNDLDYMPVAGVNPFGFSTSNPALANRPLYNGNIERSITVLSKLTGPRLDRAYGYDQLNRLKSVNGVRNIDPNTNTASYVEGFWYDGNGNISQVIRQSFPDTQLSDNILYSYNKDSKGHLINNRLPGVSDFITGSHGGDFNGTSNFTYDQIGNLIQDSQGHISNINWSVYGKIQQITKTTGGSITYKYDPAGNRQSKTDSAGLTTYYVRDAQGNTLAVYDNAHSLTNWREQHLYGSSRIGMWTPNLNLTGTVTTNMVWDTVGRKQYELDNHLGNVMVTISDKRTAWNLVPNNFENFDGANAAAQVNNWLRNNIITQQVVNGRMKITSATNNAAGVVHTIPTTPGQQYKFNFDLDPGDCPQVRVQLFTDPSSSSPTPAYENFVTSAGSQTVSFTATNYVTLIEIDRMGDAGVSHSFYIDNVNYGQSSGIYYQPDVLTAQDYDAFGGLTRGRTYTAPGSGNYRYGFNGKENDNDVGKGTGNQQDYGMRIYNPQLGRFLSTDPFSKSYPYLTPYQFAGNRPINSIDIDGAEAFEVIHWLANTGTSRQSAIIAAPYTKAIFKINEKQTLMAFGFANGVISGADAIGLSEQYKKYQYEAIKQMFSMHYDTFMQEDFSFDKVKKLFPELRMAEDAYNGLVATINKAYAGDPYAGGQVYGMCVTALIGGVEEGDIIALRNAGKNGVAAAEILEENILKPELKPYGGPGGGHHVPAKKAFEGAPNYDMNKALAIPNEELSRLNVNHGLITGAQMKAYKAFAATGKTLTWEAVSTIETNALIKGGMEQGAARATVTEAINNLKQSGVTAPTKIPWSAKQ